MRAGHSMPASDPDIVYISDLRSQSPSLHNQNFQWSTSLSKSLKQPVPHLLTPYSKLHPFPILPVFSSVHGTDQFLAHHVTYLSVFAHQNVSSLRAGLVCFVHHTVPST